MVVEISAKRGDTFGEDVIAYIDDAMTTPRDLTGVTVACQGKLVGSNTTISLTVTITDAAQGLFRLSADAAATALWETGYYAMDIEFTDSTGVVNSTDTFYLKLIEDITNAN